MSSNALINKYSVV